MLTMVTGLIMALLSVAVNGIQTNPSAAGAATPVSVVRLDSTTWVHNPTTPVMLKSLGVPHTDNSSDVPLFQQAFLNVSLYNTSSAVLSWMYPPNYPDQWTVSAGGNGGSSAAQPWIQQHHYYYPNMLTGLEYIEGTTVAVSNFNVGEDGATLNFTTTRTARSSQQKSFKIKELHSFVVVQATSKHNGLNTPTYLNYTASGLSPWVESFSYLYETMTPGMSQQQVVEGGDESQLLDSGLLRRRYFSRQKQEVLTKTATAAATVRSEKTVAKEKKNTVRQLPDNVQCHSPSTLLEVSSNPTASYVVYLNDSWTINDGGVAENAFLLTLQGLVNRHAPRLYFIYPPSWPWTDTEALFGFYNSTKENPELNITTLCSLDDVLTVFFSPTFVNASAIPQQAVQWDLNSRQSLLAAWTIAGVSDYLVVDASFLTLLNGKLSHGLSVAVNLVGTFTNMTDLESTTWLYKRYWNQTTKQEVMWMGGEMGNVIQPGMADVGVQRRCFFAALSTSPTQMTSVNTTGEYNMSSKMLGEMNKGFFLLGWHAYNKDAEHTFTTLASRHVGTVHGLNSNPNLSWGGQVPLPKNFTFQPNHQQTVHRRRRLSSATNKKAKYQSQSAALGASSSSSGGDNTVKVALVQTDGLGLGAWTKPGRGALPYTWEITLPDLVLQPAILRYFYHNATQNDFFTAALGGPGYMYPKAVPANWLSSQLQRAGSMMKTLGLRSLVIFDASNTSGQDTPMGNTNLPKNITDDYFWNIPHAHGFLNGYSAAYTFQHSSLATHGGKGPIRNQSLLSFDYYVDPSRSFDDVVKDLRMLTRVNPIRPYFMAVHVREFNTEYRTARILDEFERLSGSHLELLSADNFLSQAAVNPTYHDTNRFPHHD